MVLSDGFKTFVAELLAPLGPIDIKRMFGGASIYAGGKIFALLDDDALYFKVDDSTKGRFEDEGMGPLIYPSKNGPMTMGRYRRVPDRLFDAEDELLAWAREAIGIAERDAPARGKRAARPGGRAKKE